MKTAFDHRSWHGFRIKTILRRGMMKNEYSAANNIDVLRLPKNLLEFHCYIVNSEFGKL